MKLSPSAPLTSDHHVADFDCGEESLNRWLRERGQRSEGRTARSYVVCDEEGRVAGYYCLAAASLARANAPGKIRHNAPDPLPIIVLQTYRGPSISGSRNRVRPRTGRDTQDRLVAKQHRDARAAA